jgi:hypothetical protein
MKIFPFDATYDDLVFSPDGFFSNGQVILNRF